MAFVPEYLGLSADEAVLRAIEIVLGARFLIPFSSVEVQIYVGHDFNHDVNVLFPCQVDQPAASRAGFLDHETSLPFDEPLPHP